MSVNIRTLVPKPVCYGQKMMLSADVSAAAPSREGCLVRNVTLWVLRNVIAGVRSEECGQRRDHTLKVVSDEQQGGNWGFYVVAICLLSSQEGYRSEY